MSGRASLAARYARGMNYPIRRTRFSCRGPSRQQLTFKPMRTRLISDDAAEFVMTMNVRPLLPKLQVIRRTLQARRVQGRHGWGSVRAMTSAAGLPKPPIRTASLAARVWREFQVDHCTLLAASIAYHVLFSLVPLMTLTLAIMG